MCESVCDCVKSFVKEWGECVRVCEEFCERMCDCVKNFVKEYVKACEVFC